MVLSKTQRIAAISVAVAALILFLFSAPLRFLSIPPLSSAARCRSRLRGRGSPV